MTKDKLIEENFSDILSMLKKKVQEKDEEIMRLREENIKLKEKLTEIDPDFVLEETFKRRYNNQFVKHLNLTVKQFNWKEEYRLFYCYPEDIVSLQDKIMFESNALNRVFDSVPKVGITQFLLSCLIEEIKASNDIEGVRSTRKEIREALSSQDKPDPDKRLWGIVNKYTKIITGEVVKMETPADIRALYDEFILSEIKKDNPENVPDGILFRKDSVDVVTSSGKPIHRGIFPETKIIAYLEETLKILHDPVIPALFRIAIFHYLFGYIHPFYDGNGRTVRFITSSLLASVLNPSVALRLSVLIKQHKKDYYALFENTNSAINCGDLTPFILWSLRFVLLSITSTKEILLARKNSLAILEQRLKDVVEALKTLGEKINKQSTSNESIRLFRNNQYSLINMQDDTEKQLEELHQKQKEIIKSVYEKSGVESVIQFAAQVENKALVGRFVSNIFTEKELKRLIASSTDILNDELLRGIVWNLSFEQLKTLIKDFSETDRAKLFSILLLSDNIVETIQYFTPGAAKIFWENVSGIGNGLIKNEFITVSIKSLNQIARTELSVEILYDLLKLRKVEVSEELVIETLQDFVQQNNINQMEVYYLQYLIKWLQSKKTNKNKMLFIEWKYLSILDSYSNCKPQYLWNELSSNPVFFVDILKKFAGRGLEEISDSETKSKISMHCYDLLNHWKQMPGLQDADRVDIDLINSWIYGVKQNCEETDLFNLAMDFLGKTFFYAPKNEDGFFINIKIAELLQSDKEGSMREGYYLEAVNSRGAHFTDFSGKQEFSLEADYKEKAQLALEKGLFRFAKTLSKIAESFHNDALNNMKYVRPFLKTTWYYDAHAKEYAELTVKADMSPAYDRFLAYLPAGAAILDAGCGSGRDSLCFMKKGYDVTMLDASEGMCNCAEELTGRKALCMGFHEIEFADRFNGIWACASLLHVSEKELKNVLAIFHRALKRDGVLYASWKYGEAERMDGGRFYCDMTEEKLRRVLARVDLKAREDIEANKGLKAREGLEACEDLEARVGLFDCLECWVAEDALPSGREQKWLNVVLGKCHREDPVVTK